MSLGTRATRRSSAPQSLTTPTASFTIGPPTVPVSLIPHREPAQGRPSAWDGPLDPARPTSPPAMLSLG